MDEEFQKIADQATRGAAALVCSVGEYQAGLAFIIDEIKTALQASREMDS